MSYALRGVPVTELPVPEGVLNLSGEWYYEEYARGAGIGSVGIRNAAPATIDSVSQPSPNEPISVLPPADERKRILDLFNN